MVVMLGVDVPKGTHTTVGTDEVGKQLGERAVRAIDAGHGSWLVGPAGAGPTRSGCVRWRTAGTSQRGWSGRCWRLGSGWCGCHRS